MIRWSPGEPVRSLVSGRSPLRTVLVVLAVVVLTAGCSGLVGSDDVDDSAPLDHVPEEADGLVHVKTAVLTDSVTESVMDGLAEREAPAGVNEEVGEPESWNEALEALENETDVDREEIHSVTMFGGGSTAQDGQEYAGFILQSDLSWEDFEAMADDDVETDDIAEDTYNDVTVYVEDDERGDADAWVADFGDGTFAMGPEAVVKDVIDTRKGDAPGIDEELQSTYEDATDGYLTAAFTLSDEQSDAAGDIAAEEAGIGEMFLPDVEAVTMSYHTEGDQLNAELDVVLQSAEDAETFTSFLEPMIDPANVDGDPDPEEQAFEWFVDRTTIDSNDERVSLAFRADPDELLTALETLEESGPFGPGTFGAEFSVQSAVPVTAS